MKTPQAGKNDYKDTLNLPRTGFDMKADLARKEPEFLRRWEGEGLYGALRRVRAGAPNYTLHDGPPYPTGDLHIGTGMNKILKDFIIRYRSMSGRDAPFIPGWDCHGLPIEHKVMTELGPKAESMSASEIRGLCLKFALRYVEANRRQFKSLGCLGSWDEPYLTIDRSYEAGVIRVFGRLAEKGYVYRRLKPIHWCFSCRTALAEAELEYSDRSDASIYVEFPFAPAASESLRKTAGLSPDAGEVSILIWTTTPWTLPANLAVAVQPGIEYVLLRVPRPGGESALLVLAAAAAGRVGSALGIPVEAAGSIAGKNLEGLEYFHPLNGTACPVIAADYVSCEEGTGCVHIAPGHGSDDYNSGVRYGLKPFSPVDAGGCFTAEAGEGLAGKGVFQANPEIIERLRSRGLLRAQEEITHSYPHCWRCHNPVIFRATPQWFVSLSHLDLRRRVLEEVDKVRWVPEWGYNRIRGMLEGRPDWCISRQRNWGVPIPAFYCRSCGEALIDPAAIEGIARIFERDGSDAWFSRSPGELLPESAACRSCGGKDFLKENDIFDVWFESGSSHRSVLMNYPGLKFPADLYLEGSDQHRGWFQLSLLLATASEDRAPFQSVLTHGFVVDGRGEKMSKSRGNFISVEEALKKYPADILRLWFSSIDYRRDINVSFDLIEQTAEAYRKIRNTFRHALGNLFDFSPPAAVGPDKMEEIDRWIMAAAAELRDQVTEAYEEFEFHRVYRDIHGFCVLLSTVYLDVQKDRLYTWPADSRERRSCQTALREIVVLLAKLLAPILPFTAEEVWGRISPESPSVHLETWPPELDRWKDPGLKPRWERLLAIRDGVLKRLEESRAAGEFGTSLAAEVVLETSDEELMRFLGQYQGLLKTLFIVSSVRLEYRPDGQDFGVRVGPAPGEKCRRCWKYSPTLGESEAHPSLCRECVEHIGAQPRV